MSPILSQLVRFFEDDGWPFEQISDLPALHTGFSGENGKWTCYAHAREEVHQFVFYSLLPVNTPPDKLDAMAEFMTRANYGMIVGNFELNYEDGEVRYKTSIDIGDGDLSLVRSRIEGIPVRLEQIWAESASSGRDPAAVADSMAQRLIGR